MKKKIDVVAVGSLNPDMIVLGEAPADPAALKQWVGVSRVEMTPAGSVGYTAVDLARLGLRVSLLSATADDGLGRWLREELQKEGVDTEAIAVTPRTISGLGIYFLLFGSRKRPLTGRLATHPPWPARLSSVARQKLGQARLLHCGGYLHYPQMWGAPSERLFRQAKKLGLITSLDSQFPMTPVEGSWLKCFGNLLASVDLIFTDEVEVGAITGESDPEKASRALLAAGPRLVAIKRGAEGALLATCQETVSQPAFPVKKVIDSIGAGDAFDAGVIYATLAGFDLKATARFAGATAALTLAGMGGIQTAPTLAQVKKFLSG